MNDLLIIAGCFVGGFYLFSSTWLHYLAIMNLKAHKDELTKYTKALAAPHVVTGFVLDVLLNVLVATFIFRELPREWLLTTRLKRHIKLSQGWRLRRAAFICDNFLNPFDPKGSHCN